MQLGEAGGIARERTAVVRRSPPRLLGLDLQVHDGVRGERIAHALGGECSAAEGDHPGIRPLEQLQHHLFLARAKGGLPLAVEERLDRLAEPLLHQAIRIERLGSQPGGQRPRAGRLAGPHEANENQGPAGYPRLQPMRSS